MARSFVLLGGSGDLAGRLLLPGLARLQAAARVDPPEEITALSQAPWGDERYRQWAKDRLQAHAADLDEKTREDLVGRLRHLHGDVTSPEDLAAVLERAGGGPVIYLALPNTLFLPTLQGLARVGVPAGTTIVVEKPFGRDEADARTLNRVLHGLVPEESVFRVDHFLAKQTVLNVIGLRFANRLFEPAWNCNHIAGVDLVFDEGLGLEGRAGYYDTAGALRDMLQNHLLQLLALVAMEPPLAFDRASLAVHKTEVLRAVRPPADPRSGSARARYTAGSVGGRTLPDYVKEPGVHPARRTETYAELTVTIDNWRWSGVPFRLRTGKALGTGRREIVVRFKPVPHLAYASAQPLPDELRFVLGPDGIGLCLNINGADEPFRLQRQELRLCSSPQSLPAYALLLEEILGGDHVLSISDAEAEESWRIVEPVLRAWEADLVPLQSYAAGSAGPVRGAVEDGGSPTSAAEDRGVMGGVFVGGVQS
jgi:glucose-6-phosphate 1-dehydrogenase